MLKQDMDYEIDQEARHLKSGDLSSDWWIKDTK